jgi:PAS domain S-box-containing protein
MRKNEERYGDVKDSRDKNQQILQLLSTAIEYTASTVVITNEKGVIEFVNPAFTKISGYTEEEAIGKTPAVLKSNIHSRSHYENLWKTILSGNVWKGEFYNLRKDGGFYWESAIITPIIDKYSGNVTHFVAIKEDITKTKYQVEQLEKSEQKLSELNVTKDKFFSIIGHDLKNPISAVLGLSEVLFETLTPENEGFEYATAIHESVLSIDNLLNKLLIWSQTQNSKIKLNLSAVRIDKLIDDIMVIVEPIAQNKGIDLRTTIENEIIAKIDHNMISSVLQNLITNAIKFTRKGGEVNISVSKQPGKLNFSVSDTGVGMTAKQLQKLFRLDKASSSRGTNNEPGTGLGLIICKEFVESHRGEIWVESTLGKGSKFYFSIPLSD